MVIVGISLFLLIVIGMISSARFESPTGSMGRGLPIWGETLDKELVEYLRRLPNGTTVSDLFESKPNLSTSFLRKEANQVLVRVVSNTRGFWPWKYVGFVDLNGMEPELEYRVHSMALLVPLFMVVIGGVEFLTSGFEWRALLIPVFAILFTGAIHLVERSHILNYLRDRLKESQTKAEAKSKLSEQGKTRVVTDRRSYIAKLRGYNK